MKKYDVFVSYSSHDQKYAEAICAFLEKRGITCFIAYRDISPTSVWATSIVEAIVSSRMMLVVFSENYNVSVQVDRELELASDELLPILTFRITNDKLKGAKRFYLKNVHWMDAYPFPERRFGALVDNISCLLEKNVPIVKRVGIKKNWVVFAVLLCAAVAILLGVKCFDSSSYIERELGLNIKMIYVEGGEFKMGGTMEQIEEAEIDEFPVVDVTLDSFYISEKEITQSQWEAVMNTTIYQQLQKANASMGARGIGPDFPMYYVSWNEARDFCQELSVLTGKTYMLPSEAQWEYAARGGNKSKGNKYSGSYAADLVAWHQYNSGGSTHPVGEKRDNELGLYDMSGNVWEWCYDYYGELPTTPKKNPIGPSNGVERVLRGGAWGVDASACRVSNRNSNLPDSRYHNRGFRIVCIP